jgi:hypothetical protein
MVEQTTDQQMEEVFNTGDNEVTLGDLIQARETVDTTSDQDTMLEAIMRDAGFDPDVERTTTFLPKISREESYEDINELDITAPQALYDAVETMALFDAVDRGYEPTQEEILNAAMNMTGSSLVTSAIKGPTKKASEEVLGMGVVPKKDIAKSQAKDLKEKFGFTQDNPATYSGEQGENWLVEKMRMAADTGDPTRLRGSVTATLGKQKGKDMYLPVDMLKNLKGAKDEIRKPGEYQYERLMKDVTQEGFDPSQKGNKINIGVNAGGQPYILEGNTRVAVASDLGIPYVRVEINYFNGGEMRGSKGYENLKHLEYFYPTKSTNFSPDNIISVAKTSDEIKNTIPKTLKSKPTPKETKEEVISFRNNDEQIAKWRDANRVSQKQTQIPEVAQAARDLFEDKITSRKFREIVQKYNPIKKITTENFPNLPTNKDITGALQNVQRQKLLNVDVDIPDGTVVGARLDIPAYEYYDTWVVTLHEGGRGAAKAYGQVAVLKGGIEFKSATDTALGIARDRRTIKKGENVLVGKQTIGRMEGKFYNSDPEETYKKAYDIVANPDKYPEWTQVGFNPYRQSQFYNKDTGMPIFDADEVIQVGPLVLAKDVKKPTRQQLRQLRVRVGEIDPETGLDVRKKTTKSVTPFMSEKTEIKIENILDSYNSRENPISAKEVHKQLKEIKTDKAPEGFKVNLKQPEYGPTGAGVYEVQNIKTGEIHEIFQDPSRVLNVKEVEKFKLMNKGGMATQMKDVFNIQEDT